MIVFGHRGARGEAPENTLAGFAYARRAGVAAFELDVRLTADEQLAVIHDATVDRTTSATGPVSALTAAQLAQLDARSTFPEWPATPEPTGVPRLQDVLDVYAAHVRFAIEIKSDSPDRLERVGAQVVEHIERYHLLGRVAVSSFDRVALEIVHRLRSDVPLAFIGAFDTPEYLAAALRLGCAQVDVPLKTGTVDVVREAHEHGLRVVGWQGNTPQDIENLLAWGVDGMTSDYPSRALALLRQRGITTGDWS